MSTTKAVASNTLIQVVGRLLSVVVSLALLAILGRLLGVEGMGQYTTVIAFLGLVAIFADLGFFTILVRELSLPGRDQAKVLGNVLTLRLLLALVVYGLGLLIGWQLDYPPVVLAGLGIVTLGQFVQTLQTTLAGVLQATLRMGRGVVADLVGRVLLLAAVALIAANAGGLVEVFWATTATFGVSFLLYLGLTNQLVPVRLRADLAYWRYLIAETLPLGINSILAYLYFKLDTILLSVMKSAVEVGIYGVPFRILEVLIAIPGFFINSVFPVLTNLYERGDPKWQTAFQRSLDALSLVALPVTAGGILLAEPLIGIAGPEFLAASTVTALGIPITPVVILRILMVGLLASYLSYIFNALVLAAGKQRWLILPNVLYAVFNIGGNLIFMPRWSYLAAALLTVATEFLILACSAALALRLIQSRISWRVFGISIVASLVMVGVLLAVPGTSLGLEVPLALMVYGGVAYRLGAIDAELLRLLVRRST